MTKTTSKIKICRGWLKVKSKMSHEDLKKAATIQLQTYVRDIRKKDIDLCRFNAEAAVSKYLM